MTDSERTREPITEEGLAELEAEIEELEGPVATEMAERIKAARELGDLKENAEYHIAKDDQAHLETRIKRLRMRLRDAAVVEVDESADAFAFGRTAEVREVGNDKLHTWTLVGSTEADVTAGQDLGRVAGRHGAARQQDRRRRQGRDPRRRARLQDHQARRLRRRAAGAGASRT